MVYTKFYCIDLVVSAGPIVVYAVTVECGLRAIGYVLHRVILVDTLTYLTSQADLPIMWHTLKK